MQPVITEHIEARIYTFRGKQVMVDRDLADLYDVETKVLNQAVKRNLARFPASFRFRLTEEEFAELRSQFVTSTQHGGRRYLPYVFSEQGVAMLSAVLRSETAVKVSIQIMQAFVNMRKFLLNNASVFQRLETLELKQVNTDEKVEQIFKALDTERLRPQKGVFFDGEVFDAYAFVVGLIKQARKSILLVDNYVDESVLTMFTKRREGVKVTLFTKKISEALKLDVKKHNQQYPGLQVRRLKSSHDRFFIIDEKHLYHIGASLKDVGKKMVCFFTNGHFGRSSMQGIRLK